MKRKTNPFIVVLIALVLGATLFFIAIPGDDTPPNDNGEIEIPEPLDLSGVTWEVSTGSEIIHGFICAVYEDAQSSTYDVKVDQHGNYVHEWTVIHLNGKIAVHDPHDPNQQGQPFATVIGNYEEGMTEDAKILFPGIIQFKDYTGQYLCEGLDYKIHDAYGGETYVHYRAVSLISENPEDFVNPEDAGPCDLSFTAFVITIIEYTGV